MILRLMPISWLRSTTIGWPSFRRRTFSSVMPSSIPGWPSFSLTNRALIMDGQPLSVFLVIVRECLGERFERYTLVLLCVSDTHLPDDLFSLLNGFQAGV